MIKTSYNRKSKITDKLVKAMLLKDEIFFKKWHKIAIKEYPEKYFNSIFMDELRLLVTSPMCDFFSFLLKEVKNEFKDEDLKKLLIPILSCNNVEAYKLIKDLFGKDFYADSFFKNQPSYGSIIGAYYRDDFSYDFENVLDLQPTKRIYDYCSGIHINGVQDKSMTDILFSKLSLPDSFELLKKNLIKSIQGNKPSSIEYFYLKLVFENQITNDYRDELVISCLTDTIKKNPENISFSRISVDKQNELREIISKPLSASMLTLGGQYFKELLDKIEFKNKIQGSLCEKKINKTVKI